MEELSLVLWRERELLELLAYRLGIERLVVDIGNTRWVDRASRDVEDVLTTLRSIEILRSIAAGEAARTLGLDSDPSLARLAMCAEEPWRTILLDHRDAFLALTRQIAEISEGDGLAMPAYGAGHQTFLAVHGTAEGVSDSGTAVTQPALHLVDPGL
ncbi:flagellar protein FlgN [Nocardioides sp. AN3]